MHCLSRILLIACFEGSDYIMKNPKYHVYLNSEERRLLISSLNDLRNRLIAEGKYTDLVDEVMIKTANAKIKKINVVSKCP